MYATLTRTWRSARLGGIAALIALVAAGLAAPEASAASKLDKAIDKAVHDRRETKHVKVDGHDFHIKAVSVSRSRRAREWLITGQLSHALRFRPDDQVRYRIAFDDGGRLTRFDLRIDKGGFTSLLGKGAKGLDFALQKLGLDYVDLDNKIKELSRDLGWLSSGKWRAAASKIALRITAVVADDKLGKHRDHRTKVRDHRTAPEVRDHRTVSSVRDHRTAVQVRDHRTD